MMETPLRDPIEEKILKSYQADVTRWKERGGRYKDIQPLAMGDILLLMAQIHPTKRAESKEVTRQLIEFLCDQEITTAKKIYEALGLSDKPVLKRLKLLQQHGLVRRESKRYYVATPRLQELRSRYLKRVCS